MPTLHNIDIQIPYDSNLQSKLSDLLENCTNRSGNTLFVNPTSPEFLPIISMSFVNIEEPKIVFGLEKEDAEKLIINTTGEERTSPYKYKHLSIDEISDRIKNNGRIVYVDHLGVNFPWLDGLSPTVKDLRDKLTPASAYYRFPSGENWDFIIPATSNEIESNKIDLKINRRPKFEIVSFYKSSTPIIQIDCSTNIPY